MNTKEIAILAAVGLGAFVLMRKASAGGVYQPGVNPNLTNARPVYYPPGTQLTAAQQQAQMQAQIDAQKYGALYGIASLLKGAFSGGGSTSGTMGGGTVQVNNDDLPGQPGYGWRYFTDGVSISPTGTYYKDGQAVWMPNDYAAVNTPFNNYLPDAGTVDGSGW